MSKIDVNETLKLTFPRKPAYEKVGDYINSKNVVQNVQLPTHKNDTARTDPELQLTNARRIYTKTSEALIDRRDFHRRERVKLDNQWKDLETLEHHLRDNFNRLSGFVTTNDEKRSRAIILRTENIRLCKQRTQELEALREKMSELNEVRKDLEKQIHNHIMYNVYLDSVIAAAPLDFKNIEDLIFRYESLIETKKELGYRQMHMLEELEHAKNKISRMADENAFQILGMNNVLATLNTRYQNTLRRAMHWEKIVWTIREYDTTKFREITKVKQACRNLYYIMCRRKSETARIPEDDFEGQLIYIKKTLQELASVVSEAESASKKTFSSVKAETSQTS